MKLQCPCGAKYDFPTTPDMARQPIHFVCASCGLDASDFVNEMIRKEFAEQAAAGASTTDEPILTAPTRLRVATPAAPVTQTAEPPAPASPAPLCLKHPGQQTTDRCVVCQKPLCPQCLELFGYVCSPLCQARATANGISVPVYAGQRDLVTARRWRKIGKIAVALGVLVVALLGGWIWYAWFGSVPQAVFAVRFPEKVYSGAVKLCGQEQLVVLRGGTLARYDLKTQKEIWSRELLNRDELEKIATRHLKALLTLAGRDDSDNDRKMPSREKLVEQMARDASASLQLRIHGTNVWVVAPEKITRVDWASGRTLLELPRAAGFERCAATGDELIFTSTGDTGHPVVTHLHLASGQRTQDATTLPVQADFAAAGRSSGAAGNSSDLDKVAAQAQELSLPGRIALPAVLAAQANQERALAEMRDPPKANSPTTSAALNHDRFELIPSPYGPVEFSVRLIEARWVAHQAMKAPSGKSVLDGNLTVTKTADLANEMLNEQRRAQGGAVVEENESRYQLTVHQPGAPDWTGEVTGPPSVFPLKTVTIITANQTVIVLDKRNQKLWQTTLTHKVSGDAGESPFGQGPCVERGDTLYVFDQAMLTAFDLASGNARWRLPSVGVVGLFFDDHDKVYVNTTTASPDKIRYSRQIDITDKISPVIYKVDARSGKVLWHTDAHGFLVYLSGKFLYAVQSYDPGEDDDGGGNNLTAILHKPPFLRIHRLDPGNGQKLWEHFQQRAPLAMQFDGSSIELVFRNEVQVLKYLAW